MKKTTARRSLFTLCCLALLCAMQIVFARFLVIPIGSSIRFSLSFIPVVIAARRFGIGGGVMVYGLGDFLGATLFPTGGAYVPGFTVSAIISGLIYGCFLGKKGGTVRIVLSVVTSQIVCSLLLNSYWLHFYYGIPFAANVATRLIQCIIVGTLEVIFMKLFLEKICRAIKIR